ncbi:MAG: hypothetical protein ACF8QF_06540 [Phycisphaerales bacterium]
MSTASVTRGVRSGAVSAPSYGRARLWLGISAVGSVVVLAAAALAIDAPGALTSAIAHPIGALGAFIGACALLHLPFDILGGYLLPRRHGRAHPVAPAFVIGLLRGAVLHAAMLFGTACLLLLAGRIGGFALTVAAGCAAALLLLVLQEPIARLLAPMRVTRTDSDGARAVVLVSSSDEGFTGAVTGVFRARRIIMPDRWRETLRERGFAIALRRRRIAIDSGAWRRGRLVAFAFTGAGLLISALLAGPERMGTAEGVMRLSLFFTLWTFAGLLTLPTLSRAAVASIDAQLRDTVDDEAEVDAVIDRLDTLQDAEPERPRLVETIFHPVPSVTNRQRGRDTAPLRAAWNVARSSVYLSWAGVGLLGRAVHCNCGRPALWVFLPTD